MSISRLYITLLNMALRNKTSSHGPCVSVSFGCAVVLSATKRVIALYGSASI